LLGGALTDDPVAVLTPAPQASLGDAPGLKQTRIGLSVESPKSEMRQEVRNERSGGIVTAHMQRKGLNEIVFTKVELNRERQCGETAPSWVGKVSTRGERLDPPDEVCSLAEGSGTEGLRNVLDRPRIRR
jgi:hypothetical protein